MKTLALAVLMIALAAGPSLACAPCPEVPVCHCPAYGVTLACAGPYCAKPAPCVPCVPKACGCDRYCRKPLPCVVRPACGCGDHYCRKPMPVVCCPLHCCP